MGAWVVVGAGATVVVVGLTITGGGSVTGAAVEQIDAAKLFPGNVEEGDNRR